MGVRATESTQVHANRLNCRGHAIAALSREASDYVGTIWVDREKFGELAMSKSFFVLLGSLGLVVALVLMLMQGDRQGGVGNRPEGERSVEIMVYCAASNQGVMEAVRQDYEALTGRKVVVQYGPSQTLLAQLEVAGVGDLYLPADDSFLQMGTAKGLVAEVLPLADMRVGVAVQRGNPKGVASLADLVSSEVRLVQASSDATAVGKLTKKVLEQQGVWKSLQEATDAFRTTVNEVAADVQVGAAEAGIVYDVVLHPFKDLEFVELPEFKEMVSRVSLGVLTTTRQADVALHFARYVAARDQGLKRYQEYGFRVIEGDVWADTPELVVYAGSMLRPAIEETIVAFEQREGVRVSRAYNGCGILVAQMKSGQQPDAYFACDAEFMKQVSDLFPQSVEVSRNELVILVPKGNPQGIGSLRDLTKPGLRVGVGHEKQCAMGWITQNVFRESGLQSELMSNVTVQTPTGDMLVNQLRTGSLDAAVAYLSNAAGAAEFLDAIQIVGIPCSTAIQPWGVAKNSKYPQLAARLFDKIRAAESQEIFVAEGFQWTLKEKYEK